MNLDLYGYTVSTAVATFYRNYNGTSSALCAPNNGETKTGSTDNINYSLYRTSGIDLYITITAKRALKKVWYTTGSIDSVNWTSKGAVASGGSILNNVLVPHYGLIYIIVMN